MKLVTVSMEEINKPSVRSPQKNVRKLLDEFWESGNPIMRVDYDVNEYVSPSSAKSSFLGAIKRSGYNVITIVKNGKLYLIRSSNMK